MRILFITSNRLGDAVLSTGLLSHLIEHHPGARLTIACGPLPAPLFRAVPGLERLIPMPKRRFSGHWVELWRLCVGTAWDLVVDLRNSAVSRLIASRRRAIFSRPTPGLHKVAEVGRVMDLTPPPAPRLWLDDAARAAADHLLPNGSVPVLAIGPTANWRGKEWPAQRFAAAALRLTGAGGALAGSRVAVFAAPSEGARAAPVLDALGERALDLTGRTDPQTAAACLERAALYIGNDSGLMHIAAAVGTPTIGLFGPGFPEVYGPWGAHAAVVSAEEPRDTLLERARQDHAATDLMDGVPVARVVKAAERLLSIRLPNGDIRSRSPRRAVTVEPSD